MKIHLLSDLHLEFDRGDLWLPPKVDADVLVLAGDIAVGQMHLPWLQAMTDRYAFVLYIPGNHEYYNCDVLQDLNDVYLRWEEYGQLKNFVFLHNRSCIIDDIHFIGATLWTDFNNDNFHVREIVRKGLNDYRRIYYLVNGLGKKVLPTNILAEHRASLAHINKELNEPKGAKRVVVTHHAPSEQSISEHYRRVGGDLNYAYFSSLEPLAEKADFWFHGHVHHPASYEIGKCRVVTNPRGYERAGEKTGYNPGLTIEV